MWLGMLGRPLGTPVPSSVDRRKLSRRKLVAAMHVQAHVDAAVAHTLINEGPEKGVLVEFELK